MILLAAFLASSLVLAPASLARQASSNTPASAADARPDAQKPDAKKDDARPKPFVVHPEAPSVTHHTVTIAGQPVHYTATAGTLTLFDEDKDNKPTAKIFYISYRRTERPHADYEKFVKDFKAQKGEDATPPSNYPDASTRPITFSFNGGPGSSSVWLHLGVFGPKRVNYIDEAGHPGPPPYRVIENAYSLLDVSDFVFIDPVSTGYSRAEEGVSEKDFHGVESDIASVAEFIRRFLTTDQRWGSPKFVAGESYGTTRAAGLTDFLNDRHGIAVNGVVLVSAVLEFGSIRFAPGNDAPFMLFMPSYAASAHFHKRCAERYQRMPLDVFLNEVRDYTLGEYGSALLKGSTITDEEKDRVAQRLSEYTGLSAEYLKRANLRVSQPRFCKELLRDASRTVGRFDSRFTGIDIDDAGESYEYDPSYAAIRSNYTQAFNGFVRGELGYTSDLSYEILTNVQPWSFDPAGNNRPLNVAERLRGVMHEQPYLRVLLASGYYDLATPFFAADFTRDHMMLAPDRRGNFTTKYYEGGHMMYLHRPSLEQMRKDLLEFYRETPAGGR
ncbi:MAG TPA: peptidase S10 [Phycisphaerales bacterium]|nr:peptidase S10 [Phycisphaerales bacterium]